jgi:cytochrome c5
MLRRIWCASGSWLAIVTAAAALAASPRPQQVDRGEQILNGSCITCHDARPIRTQALDKDGWTKMVAGMVEKGAEVKPEDLPVLIEYLVNNHGPLPEGAGKNVLLNVCTECHDLKRVLRHGATREQWEETLIAMLNEGAPLTEQDFPVLLAYLARNFKPQ